MAQRVNGQRQQRPCRHQLPAQLHLKNIKIMFHFIIAVLSLARSQTTTPSSYSTASVNTSATSDFFFRRQNCCSSVWVPVQNDEQDKEPTEQICARSVSCEHDFFIPAPITFCTIWPLRTLTQALHPVPQKHSTPLCAENLSVENMTDVALADFIDPSWTKVPQITVTNLSDESDGIFTLKMEKTIDVRMYITSFWATKQQKASIQTHTLHTWTTRTWVWCVKPDHSSD